MEIWRNVFHENISLRQQVGGGSQPEYVMRPRGAVIVECGGSHDLSFQHKLHCRSPLSSDLGLGH